MEQFKACFTAVFAWVILSIKDLTKSIDKKTFFHNYLLISLIEQNDEMENALQIMISEKDVIIAIKLTDLEMPPEWSLSMKIIPFLFYSQ